MLFSCDVLHWAQTISVDRSAALPLTRRSLRGRLLKTCFKLCKFIIVLFE